MARQDVLDLYRDRGLSLAEFQVGDNDELMTHLAALTQRAEFQFLYLWGGRAVGKSHLLQGLCSDFHAYGKSSVYIPLTLAELQPDVLNGLENLALVCLDDIDSRLAQADWESAIFHLFNQLREQQATLVVGAQGAPRQTVVQLADLKSRLSWGLAYQVHALPARLVGDYLRQQGQRRGIELSAPVVNYILSHYARDMASLLSLLEQLDRQSLEQQRRITVPFLKQVLEASFD